MGAGCGASNVAMSVQCLLGHPSAAMALKVYAHHLPGAGEATAAVIESALG